jgi:hypothetical protein
MKLIATFFLYSLLLHGYSAISADGGVPIGTLAWDSPKEIELFANNGTTKAIVRTSLAPVRFSDGTVGQYLKTVEYRTNALVWMGPAAYQHFAFWNGRIVGFYTLNIMDLWVSPSSHRRSNGVDAVAHVRREAARDERFLSRALTERHSIDLNDVFGTGAFMRKRDAHYIEPQIETIAVENAKCRLFLKGYNGAKAQVLLNERFEPIEGVIDGKVVFPREAGKPLQK